MARTRFLLSLTLLLVQNCCVYMPKLTIGAVAAQTNISTDESALRALKAHITSDPENILTTNWSTSDSNICNWVGVTCGVRNLRVTALNLSYMGLTGTIPPHLGNLSFLVQLEFRNNSFGGTLPSELSHLRRLKLISFSFSNFAGTIPSWFGSLSELQTFDLYGNQFSGSIPNDIFNLSALQVLDLRNNQLSGSIPKEVEKLTMLKEIVLGQNNFKGIIPREIGNLTMLKTVYLDNNMFEEIPNLIGSKDQVEKLYVQVNALKGPLPLSVFNMSSLKILALSVNKMTGGIPDNLCQHLPSIQILSLAGNNFDGPLPSKLWQCKELLTLLLSNNHLTADFGIAKLLGGGDSVTQTLTLATIGYMAPEYGVEGIVSTRGDVYSFGIVMMETFTKRKPTDEMFAGEINLKEWIANSLPEDGITEVLDVTLLGIEDDGDIFVVKRDCLSSLMRLALACSAESPQERINIQDVVVTLNKIKIKLLKAVA